VTKQNPKGAVKVEAFTISTTIKKGIAKQAAAGSLKSAFKS